MSIGIVWSLDVGRCLEWGAVNLRAATSGIMVFCDNRVLYFVGIEVGNFSISCRFKKCEDDFCWNFTGVYGFLLIYNIIFTLDYSYGINTQCQKSPH